MSPSSGSYSLSSREEGKVLITSDRSSALFFFPPFANPSAEPQLRVFHPQRCQQRAIWALSRLWCIITHPPKTNAEERKKTELWRSRRRTSGKWEPHDVSEARACWSLPHQGLAQLSHGARHRSHRSASLHNRWCWLMTLGPFSRRNFIHGQYATTPNSVAVRWSMEPASRGISRVFDSLNYGDSSPPAVMMGGGEQHPKQLQLCQVKLPENCQGVTVHRPASTAREKSEEGGEMTWDQYRPSVREGRVRGEWGKGAGTESLRNSARQSQRGGGKEQAWD